MSVSTLTSKGQITLPKQIREHLKLQSGARVEFLVGADGTVTLWPATADVTSLRGLLPKPARPLSVKRMNEIIRQRHGARRGA